MTLTVQDESGFANDSHTDRIVVRVDESPIAEAGPDQEVCAGTEVHFDGSASRDFDGVVNRFQWDFGDGAVGGGDKPVHVYQLPGNYRVVLSIEGDQAASNTDTDEVRVRVVEAPVARIAGPSSIAVGAPALDASASSGATGQIVSWRWDFGDGSVAEGPVVEHTYEKPGAYVVRLAIETDATAAACDLPRSSTRWSPMRSRWPKPATTGWSGSTRRSCSTARRRGIRTARSRPGSGISATARALRATARHRFREPGRYEVQLTVLDDTDLPNNAATDKLIVEVNAPPEPVIDTPAVACVEDAVRFDATGSRDPNGPLERFAWSLAMARAPRGRKSSTATPRPGASRWRWWPMTVAISTTASRRRSTRCTSTSRHAPWPGPTGWSALASP